MTNYEKHIDDLMATKKPIMCKIFELRADSNEFCCLHNCHICSIESLDWLQAKTK